MKPSPCGATFQPLSFPPSETIEQEAPDWGVGGIDTFKPVPIHWVEGIPQDPLQAKAFRSIASEGGRCLERSMARKLKGFTGKFQKAFFPPPRVWWDPAVLSLHRGVAQ